MSFDYYKNPPKNKDEAIVFVVKVINENHYEVNSSADFFDVFEFEDYLNKVDYPWRSESITELGMRPHEDVKMLADNLEQLDYDEMIEIIMKAKESY